MNPDSTKILLVEDSESDADLLQEKLQAVGLGIFEITCATRLDQAIELLRRATFDAILTDMNLPDSSGKETFLRLREAAPNRPIVVLTGAEDEQLGLEAVRLGMQDYLAKSSADGPQIARAIRYAVERGRAREALRESEARYRTLFESMTEGLVQYEIVCDAHQQPGDFRCIEINPAFERLTGLKPAEVIGRTHGEMAFSPCPPVADAYRRTATTGDPVRFETFLPALNRHFAASVYRPAPTRLSVIFRDITERKAHEAELQKFNRTLRALSGSNQAMMRATDETGFLHDVCRIIEEDCGHAMVWIGFAEDDAARTVRPVAHAGFEAGYLEQLNVTWADTERGRGPTGTAVRTGKAIQCADMLTNTTFAPWRAEALKRGYGSSLAIPLIAADRTLGAITIYSRQTDAFTAEEVKLLTELAGDVSYGLTVLRMRAAHARAEQAVERARAELEVRVTERTAQLRALAAELIQTEERERRRIARLLHDDMQQLLMAAKLRVEIMRGRKDAKPLYPDLLRIEEMIAESGAAARELSHELSPSVLHEYGLAAGLKWLARWMHEKHGLTVRVVVDTATDAVEPEVAVMLFQSVRELLFNVVKHAGVKRASVCIGGTPDGGLVIQVSDKGRGLKALPGKEGSKLGAGFGLFGVRERLEFLGGRLEMTSTPGRGCCFRLSAPLRKSTEPLSSTRAEDVLSRREPGNRASGPAVASRAARRAVAVPPAKIRVLLVDDHQVVREGLTTLLAQCPDMAVVGMAADGQEAIELADTLQPQVVIMDVNMPRLDGIEATRRIAVRWPRIKVIGLTMHADKVIHHAMRSAGAVGCLVKSGPTEALLHAIRTAMAPSARRG